MIMLRSAKSTLWLFFLSFGFTALLHATPADSLFTEGNKAYAENNFSEAIRLYEQVDAEGYESAELYFNLGNAYYKNRRYPKAILNYERALRLDPLNENIQFNLEKARLYNVDQVDVIPEFILKRGIRKLVEIFSSNTWAMISMIGFVLALVMFLVYFLSLKISLKRLGFYTGIVLLLMTVGTFFLAESSKRMLVESGAAIIMTPTVTVKGSPSESSTDLFIIHEGTRVFILDQLDSWYEIKLSDGKQGWLLQSDVEVI